jgi:hypothetical protein
MQSMVTGSPISTKYAASVDRESAREMLAARLEAGAAKASREKTAGEVPRGRRSGGGSEGTRDERPSYPEDSRTRPRADRDRGDRVSEVLGSPIAKEIMRTAAREIARGVFRIGRR